MKEIMTSSSPNLNSAALKKVIQWCTHHEDDPSPEDDENKEKQRDDIPVWEEGFLKVSQGTRFELTLAANYLNIKVVNIRQTVDRCNSKSTGKKYVDKTIILAYTFVSFHIKNCSMFDFILIKFLFTQLSRLLISTFKIREYQTETNLDENEIDIERAGRNISKRNCNT
eukprot:bmy_13193T0